MDKVRQVESPEHVCCLFRLAVVVEFHSNVWPLIKGKKHNKEVKDARVHRDLLISESIAE